MVPSRYLCPYCSWTKSRRDDLIRFHIVDKHPEKLMAVRENPELIRKVSPGEDHREDRSQEERSEDGTRVRGKMDETFKRKREPEKQKSEEPTCSKKKSKKTNYGEQKREEKKSHQDGKENHAASNREDKIKKRDDTRKECSATITKEDKKEEEEIRKEHATEIVKDEEAEKEEGTREETEKDADTETLKTDIPLFKHLDGIIAGAEHRGESSGNTVAQSELQLAVRSILPHINTEAPSMYIPDCESISTQYSPQKMTNEEVGPQEMNIPTPTAPVSTLSSVMASVMASPISINSSPTVPNILPSAPKANRSHQIPNHLRQNVRYLETHCRHGILRPIHVHIRKEVFKPNGERVRQHEIQINCAFCPPPTIKKIAEVEGLPGQSRRSSTPRSTSAEFNLSSSSDDSV